MKIISLQAQGVKRLVAVDITPNPGMNRVGGFNGEGKTSLLDTIAMGFGGADQIPMKPLRTGEEYGVIRIAAGTGDEAALRITRYFTDEGTTALKVQSGDGATYEKGQTKLNEIIGAISFDPIRFADMDPKAQAAELRRLVPLDVDLDDLSRKDKADLLARRDVNRDAKALVPRINAIVLPEPMPAKPDRDAIVVALGSAGETNSAIERERQRREVHDQERERELNGAFGCREEAVQLRARADELDKQAVAHEQYAKLMGDEAEGWEALAEPVDTVKLSTELEEADKALRVHRSAEDRKLLQAEFDALEVKSKSFTTAIQDRAAIRAKALGEAKMPVEGLSLARTCDVVPGEASEDLIVTYNGEPFAQSSRAEQIRVSMRLAMAANPKLRVMTIRDGSLLDERGFKLISEIAAEGDYQVFVEVVGEGEENGIIIEDGRVKGAPDPEVIPGPKRRKPKVEAVEPEKVETNAVDHDVAIVGDKLVVDGAVVPEVKSITSTSGPGLVEGSDGLSKIPTPEKPAGRKAMREFSTKPLGGDLFGGEK